MFLKNREGETPPDCCSHNSKAWAALQANRRERDAKNTRHSREEKILHRLKLYRIILEGWFESSVTLKAYQMAKHCTFEPVSCVRFS